MSTLSTHALDTAIGKPAAGLPLMLEYQPDPLAWKQYCQDRLASRPSIKPQWEFISRGMTNADGRCPELLEKGTTLGPGLYRMDFDTQSYFEKNDIVGFYPLVQVIFEISASDEHYHIPLLLSPYGYSTYRGS
ncbi:MAG: hydroxyisourate hydrolase [Candidatus Melainabacteria bacterium HGW-Melainabacteria-1]|nr:MAG: hydroxyisourate hydrolase [Candidatus Melainabacteria bacterium HGW-Melainabacteria-1]